MFTVHVLFYGHTFPMAYCLLPNKQRQSYNRAFLHLKDKAVAMGLSLDPLVVVSDFELAMVQAAAMSFPTHTTVAATTILCKPFGGRYGHSLTM